MAVIYSESVDGDLSNSAASPTQITLAPGNNTIVTGQDGDPRDVDYLTVVVPAGTTLNAVELTAFLGFQSPPEPANLAFIAFEQGPRYTGGTSGVGGDQLGAALYGDAQIGADLLDIMSEGFGSAGYTQPLQAGEYSFWLNQTDTENASTFTFVVRGAPTPRSEIDLLTTAQETIEGDVGTRQLTYIVERSGGLSSAASVDYAITGDVSAADIGVPLSGTIDFGAFASRVSFAVPVIGDQSFEGDEAFELTLSNPIGTRLGVASATGLIRDDDQPTLSIAPSDAAKAEGEAGETPFLFTVARDGDPNLALSVGYMVAGADAADFASPLSGAIAFAAGQTEQTLSILVAGDDVTEADEPFTVALSGPTGGAALGQASAEGVIQNDDFTAGVSIAALDDKVDESNAGETSIARFSVFRSGDVSEAATVDYVVLAADLGLDAADFGGALPSGQASFDPDQEEALIEIVIEGDDAAEGDERFFVRLSEASVGLDIVGGDALATILDDDVSTYEIAPVDAIKAEGDAGQAEFAFTVTRSGGLSAAGSVDYAVLPRNTGTTSDDYAGGALPSGTVAFAAGEASAPLIIAVAGDTIPERTEGFVVSLQSPSGEGRLGDLDSATGFIEDDDGSGLTLFAVSGDQEEGTGPSTPFRFRVSRDGDLSQEISVRYDVSASGGVGDPSDDFVGGIPGGTLGTLFFASGQDTADIVIGVVGDDLVEPDETFTVALFDQTDGVSIGFGDVEATIFDDDVATLTLTIDPSSAPEGGAATARLTRNADLDSALGVAVSTDASGLTSPSSLTFAADQREIVFTITASQDDVFTGDRSIAVTASAAGYVDGSDTLSIVEDDPAPETSIGGRVWLDLDGDGVQDPGESGVDGVVLRLSAPMRAPRETATDASGAFLFSDVDPGEVEIEVLASSLAPGLVFTEPGQGVDDDLDSNVATDTGRTGPITLALGDAKLDLGVGVFALGAVSGQAFADLDADGIQDPTEPGLEGIDVTLRSERRSGSVVDATGTTGPDGLYSFENVRPGDDIRIGFSNLSFFRLSPQDQGDDDRIDSDIVFRDFISTENLTPEFTVLSGERIEDVDGGAIPNGRLLLQTFVDLDADGAFDSLIDQERGGVGYEIQDAGPDGVFDTADDAVVRAATTTDGGRGGSVNLEPPGLFRVAYDLGALADEFVFIEPGSAQAPQPSNVDPDTGLSPEYAMKPGEELQLYAGLSPRAPLSLALSQTSILEGEGVELRVARTIDGGALTVALSSSDESEATLPTEITFADGEATQTLLVSGVNDGLVDGPQLVTLTASAGAQSASITFEVRDATPQGTDEDDEITVEGPGQTVDVSGEGADDVNVDGAAGGDTTVVGFDEDDEIDVSGGEGPAEITSVERGSVIVGLDLLGDAETDLTITFVGGVFDDPSAFDDDSFEIDYDPVQNISSLSLRTAEPSGFSFILFDAGADAPIAEFEDGAVISTAAAPDDRTIEAFFTGPGAERIESMTFELIDATGNTVRTQTENFANYVLFGNSGANYFNANPDLVDGSYTLIVKAYEQNGGAGALIAEDAVNFTLGAASENAPPVITSEDAFAAPENATFVATLAGFDPEGVQFAFEPLSGPDAAVFVFDTATGALAFAAPPDFEAPGDVDGDNVYELVVTASDGVLSAAQSVAVTVENVIESGGERRTITTTVSSDGEQKGQTGVIDVTQTGGDDDLEIGQGDTTGLLFENIEIPDGATIVEAKLIVTSQRAQSVDTTLEVALSDQADIDALSGSGAVTNSSFDSIPAAAFEVSNAWAVGEVVTLSGLEAHVAALIGGSSPDSESYDLLFALSSSDGIRRIEPEEMGEDVAAVLEITYDIDTLL